jgi:serine/threonine-protein kinase
MGSAPTALTALSRPGVATSSPGSPPPSVIADRYEILGLLGAGGMGRVYRAHDKTLDEIVALKMLRRELMGTPGVLERFRQEVKLARRVTSPHVVRTFDLGQHGDDHFLTMEYIEGGSLAQRLDDGLLATDEVMRIARAAAAGIAAAHANGVLHRDLKPDNILIGKTGRVVITDFGIACAATSPVATSERFAGTPAYMAPEQVESEGVIGPATDIYAFGAILYEMLTGRRPFPGGDVVQVALARLRLPPPDAREIRPVPGTLAELALRCMARAPADRYADGAALSAALATPYTVAPQAASLMERTTPAKTSRSVAILPLRASAELDELASGLAEEIVDALSMTRSLRVRPLASVRKQAAGERDAREVGQALGVDVVVDGSIRRRGELVRISSRVIGVADGFQLWASHFDAASDALLATCDDVVRAVASALTIELEVPVRAASDRRATEIYLAAKAKLRARWLDAALVGVVADLEEAHALAPDDPAIAATLATALARATFLGAPNGPSLARAIALADRAIATAPGLGEAWFARGAACLYGGDAPGAAAALVRAVARTPGFAMAQAMLGGLLLEAGTIPGAIRHLEAAESLDPLGLAHIDLPRAYVYADRWDDAVAQYDLAREAGADSSLIFDGVAHARFKMWRGEHAEIPLPLPARVPATLRMFVEAAARVHATRAFPREARDQMAALIQVDSPRLRTTLSQFMAEFLLFAGDPDEAMQWIEASFASGLHDQLWMERCPLLEPVRALPRFRELAEKVAERGRAVVAAAMREVENPS